MSSFVDLFTKDIKIVEGTYVKVRALNVSDVVKLSKTYINEFNTVLGLLDNGALDEELLNTFFTVVPDLCFDIISLSSGRDASEIEVLPFSIQIELITAIGELTFSSPESLKKMQGIILKMSAKMLPKN